MGCSGSKGATDTSKKTTKKDKAEGEEQPDAEAENPKVSKDDFRPVKSCVPRNKRNLPSNGER